MKSLTKLFLGGSALAVVGLLLGAAVNTVSYLPGLDVANDATFHGNVTIGGVSHNAWPAGGSAIPGTLVTNGASATAGSMVKFGTRLTNVVDAASADVQAALGQVYEATNTTLKKVGGTLSGTLGFSGTATLLNIPSLTTAQKGSSSPQAGSLVYDSDLGRVQAYDGAAWHSRVRLDGDTMTGNLSAPSLITPPVTLTPRDATTWLVDMGAGSFQTNAIAGAVSLSVSNCVAGLPVTVILLGTNVSENVTYNAGLTHQASALAPSIPAGYRLIVSLLPQNADTNQVVISTIVTP